MDSPIIQFRKLPKNLNPPILIKLILAFNSLLQVFFGEKMKASRPFCVIHSVNYRDAFALVNAY